MLRFSLPLLATLALLLSVFPAAQASASRLEAAASATRPALSRAASEVPTPTSGLQEVARHNHGGHHGHKTHKRPKPGPKPPHKPQVLFPPEVVDEVCNVTTTPFVKVLAVLEDLDTNEDGTLTFEEFIPLFLNSWGTLKAHGAGYRKLLGSAVAKEEPEEDVDPYAHTLAKPFVCNPENETVETFLQQLFDQLAADTGGIEYLNFNGIVAHLPLYEPIFLATLILKDVIAPTCK